MTKSHRMCTQRRFRSAWASAQSDQSSLSVWRKLGSLATHWAHREDSDQTGRTVILLVSSWGGSNLIVTCSWSQINNLTGQPHRTIILDCTCDQMSPVRRICVFEHSVMTNFNCACPAIQRGQGSGFLCEASSWFTACMSEQRRFWRDCADAQARLNLRCSHRRLSTKFAWCGPNRNQGQYIEFIDRCRNTINTVRCYYARELYFC